MENKLRIERGFVSDETAYGVFKGIRDGGVPYPEDSVSKKLLTINGDEGKNIRFSSSRDQVQTFRDIIDEETEGKTSGILRLQEMKRADYEYAKKLVNAAVENSVMEDGGSIHLYLSTPGSAALANHTDVTDIFVLQLVGAKEWILCDNTATMMLDTNLRGKLDECTTYNEAEMDSLYCESTTLYPGDALYLPRKVVHSARATSEGLSAHLTFGFADNTCSVDEMNTWSSTMISKEDSSFVIQTKEGLIAIPVVLYGIWGDCDSSCDSNCPTPRPTRPPTRRPTPLPTTEPSASPSSNPSNSPTTAPSRVPTKIPTPAPTPGPSLPPTPGPTNPPTPGPTAAPTPSPSKLPSAQPSMEPSVEPSLLPTLTDSSSPTAVPTPKPSPGPTARPTPPPTPLPSSSPTDTPSESPSSLPSHGPSTSPTTSPSQEPSTAPTTVEIIAAVESAPTFSADAFYGLAGGAGGVILLLLFLLCRKKGRKVEKTIVDVKQRGDASIKVTKTTKFKGGFPPLIETLDFPNERTANANGYFLTDKRGVRTATQERSSQLTLAPTLSSRSQTPASQAAPTPSPKKNATEEEIPVAAAIVDDGGGDAQTPIASSPSMGSVAGGSATNKASWTSQLSPEDAKAKETARQAKSDGAAQRADEDRKAKEAARKDRSSGSRAEEERKAKEAGRGSRSNREKAARPGAFASNDGDDSRVSRKTGRNNSSRRTGSGSSSRRVSDENAAAHRHRNSGPSTPGARSSNKGAPRSSPQHSSDEARSHHRHDHNSNEPSTPGSAHHSSNEGTPRSSRHSSGEGRRHHRSSGHSTPRSSRKRGEGSSSRGSRSGRSSRSRSKRVVNSGDVEDLPPPPPMSEDVGSA